MFGSRLDDAFVGLVRDQKIDIGAAKLRGIERAVGGLAHLAHRMLEDFAAGHPDQVTAIFDDFLSHRMGGTTMRAVQQVRQAAVASHERREYACFLAGLVALYDYSARAVAEQHAG